MSHFVSSQDNSTLVVHGVGNSKFLSLAVKDLLGKGLCIQGFCIRTWIRNNQDKAVRMIESIAQLIGANKLRMAFAEFEISTHLNEAIEQALDASATEKTVLKFDQVEFTSSA